MIRNKIIMAVLIIALLLMEYIILDAFLISGWIFCAEGKLRGYTSGYQTETDLNYIRRYDKCRLNGPSYTFKNNIIQDYETFVDGKLTGISIHFDSKGNYSSITDWRKRTVYFQFNDSLKYLFYYNNQILTKFKIYESCCHKKLDINKNEEVYFEKISNNYFILKTYTELKVYDVDMQPIFELRDYIRTINNINVLYLNVQAVDTRYLYLRSLMKRLQG
jgi:hypothetical protein